MFQEERLAAAAGCLVPLSTIIEETIAYTKVWLNERGHFEYPKYLQKLYDITTLSDLGNFSHLSYSGAESFWSSSFRKPIHPLSFGRASHRGKEQNESFGN